MKRVVRKDGIIRITTFNEREKLEPRYYKPALEEFKELGEEVGLIALDVDYHKKWPNFIEALFKKI